MTTPLCLPSSLALPLFSPFSHFTHLRTTKRNGVSKPNCHSNVASCQTPNLQNFQAAWHQPTCPPNSICIESTTREGAPVAEGLPEKTNGIGDSRKKTTETEARSSPATVYACTVPGWSIPGKIWMPTNQIRALYTDARVSRELRARALQGLRVYKESRVATEPFGG